MSEDLNSTVVESLLPAVMAEAGMVTDLEHYREVLDNRLLVEQALSTLARSSSVAHHCTHARGDYSNFATPAAPPRRERSLADPLSGLERIWAEQLDASLEQKAGTGEPVIVFDFGAGLAHSLMRLAMQDKYREAILRGDLILVASNLGFLPSEEPDSDGYTKIARAMNGTNHLDESTSRLATHYSADELKLVQQNQDMITFLDANVLELAEAAITARNGTTIPLKGNADIVSEHLAVAHTHIPDIALGVLSSLLGPRGRLYVTAKSGNKLEMAPFRRITCDNGQTIETDSTYDTERRMALDIGLAAIQRTGVQQIEDIPNGPAIFSRA